MPTNLECAVRALLIALFIASPFVEAAPPEGYEFLPLDVALQRAHIDDKPMLLYFGRHGCGSCRKMHAEVFVDPELKSNLGADFVLAYVDTESSNRIRLASGERTTEMQFAAQSRILGTPTFVFFSAEQNPLFRKAGFQTISQMRDYCDYVAGGHYRSMTLADYLASR